MRPRQILRLRKSDFLTSEPHVAPIILPEAAHRGLADAALFRGGAAAAHLDERFLLTRAGDAALDEARGGAVLHGDEAGGSDQVGLAQAQLGKRLVVGYEAEAGPLQLGLVEAARHDAANREAVA